MCIRDSIVGTVVFFIAISCIFEYIKYLKRAPKIEALPPVPDGTPGKEADE